MWGQSRAEPAGRQTSLSRPPRAEQREADCAVVYDDMCEGFIGRHTAWLRKVRPTRRRTGEEWRGVFGGSGERREMEGHK